MECGRCSQTDEPTPQRRLRIKGAAIHMIKQIRSPRVFVSYAHESESHNEKVFELSERLRSEGVDCYIDQYEVSPAEGWPRWSRNQIQQADFVLVACTQTYKKRFEGSELRGTGAGAKWEGAIITQELYDSEGRNTKFIPIVFDPDEDPEHIPVEMRGGTYYVLNSDDEYDDLYRHLTNQPKTVKRELGRLRSLPLKKRKETFVSVPSEGKSPQASEQRSQQHLPLVVLWRVGGTAVFARVERIRSAGKTIALSTLPSSSREVNAVSELERNREPIGLAYNETAMFVRLKSLEKIIDQGHEVWHLEFELDEHAMSGGVFDFNLSAFSVEQIAEMRARRLLLNEKLSDSIGMRPNDLTMQLTENSVAGGSNNGFAIMGSPFPGLFQELKEETSEFLEAARLAAVLLLLLTRTVHNIERLELSMESSTELAVRFKGTRPPRYARGEVQEIVVDGICKLVAD
jgi:hypothetical protein